MKRILVIRFGALGDLVHLSAALQAVQQQSGAEIHLLTAQSAASLAQFLPDVSQWWYWNQAEGLSGLLKLAWALRRFRYDAVINLHPSIKTFLVSGILYPAKCSVYHKQKFKQKGLAQRVLPRRHATADFYQPFTSLMPNLNRDQLPAPLLAGWSIQLADSALPNLQSLRGRCIGLIPGVGSKRANRAWLASHYIELVERLLSENDRTSIVLIGGPDDVPVSEKIVNGLSEQFKPQVLNLCGRLALPETLTALHHCQVVVGGDTGPLHMAAAIGCATVGLYGPTSVQRTGPLGSGTITTLTPSEQLSCWPCEAPVCPYPVNATEHLACMQEISVSQVYAAVQAQMKQ